jgi:hypothetical protein
MADVAVALPRTRARRLPAWLARVRWPLVAIVVLGAAWTIWFVLQCQQYFIQPDELEYLKQSRLIADELHPLLPGDRYFNSWSQLQPLLLSPVWGAIHDTNVAHRVMGIVNALIMASAAIPAYLLARRVVAERWAAYLVALLSVAVPWMAAASTMMTEVAAYPAWLWAALAVQQAIARPSPRNDVIGLAGVGLAFSARPQLAVLAPALVAGVLLQELRFAAADGDPLERRRTRVRRALVASARRHRVLLGLLVAALLVYAVVRPNLFGGYSSEGVTDSVLAAPGLWEFSRELLAYVVVGVGLLPLAMAAGWVLLTLWRPAGREQHAYAVMVVVAAALLTVAVGSFTARYTPQGINSRYLYYLAPLLFIGMVALVVDRRPAALPLGLGTVLAAWVVYGSKLSQAGPSLVSPDQTFHTVLIGRTYQVGKALGMPQTAVPHLLGAVLLILAVGLIVARRSRFARSGSIAALVIVAVFCFAETTYSLRKIADTQKGVSADFINGRDWIDQVIPAGQQAQVILSDFGDPPSAYAVWWDVAFWNSSVNRSLSLPATPDLQQPFPELFSINPDGSFFAYRNERGAVMGDQPWFVRATSDRSFGFRDATVVAERFGVELVRTATTPPTAAWALYGTADMTGRVLRGAAPAQAQLFPRTAGVGQRIAARVTVGALPGAERPQRYRIGGQTGRVRPDQPVTVDVRPRVTEDGFAPLAISAPGVADAQAPRGVQVLAIETP